MAFEDEEKELIGMLESLSSKSLTMYGLENAYEKCVGCQIAMIFLADILFRAVRINLQELCGEVENLQESLSMQRESRTEDDGREECDVREEDAMYPDVCINEIVRWIEGGVEVAPSISAPILRCFLPIAYALAHAYANPCNLDMAMGNEAILSWRELQDAASIFSSVSRPRIVDALPVIRCLRRRPLLDCRQLSPEDRLKLGKFDRKWERLCSLYPVVNVLADPSLVIVEPVGGGDLPPHVATIIAAITSARNNPLPSGGGAPHLLADVVGHFTHVFQLPSMEDARAFAAMLRVQLADATGGGGAGPAVRILCLNVPPASLRLF
ncbi:hypothetical protein L7F22_011848 [Adiantum nelumboides]|nr:hypothetical protein [Adiantum nelumboides]